MAPRAFINILLHCTVESLSAFEILFLQNFPTIPPKAETHLFVSLVVKARFATDLADSLGADNPSI